MHDFAYNCILSVGSSWQVVCCAGSAVAVDPCGSVKSVPVLAGQPESITHDFFDPMRAEKEHCNWNVYCVDQTLELQANLTSFKCVTLL